MTSSDPPSERPVDDEVHEGLSEDLPEPMVLASGHLHPGMLFLRMLDGVRAMIVPTVIAVLAPQFWFFAVLGAAFFVINMAYALARFVTFQ